MWILLVIQLVAGSATAKNTTPIVYSGLESQEFTSKKNCEDAKKAILKMNDQRNDGEHTMQIRNGILSVECVPK